MGISEDRSGCHGGCTERSRRGDKEGRERCPGGPSKERPLHPKDRAGATHILEVEATVLAYELAVGRKGDGDSCTLALHSWEDDEQFIDQNDTEEQVGTHLSLNTHVLEPERPRFESCPTAFYRTLVFVIEFL